jgi:type VI secretion system protein ImpA
MATETLLNIGQLLAPISEENPYGVNLRENETPDSVYYELKDARNNARAIERNTIPGDAASDEHLEKPYWDLILKKAPQVLAEKSKDLEIAAWLTEALIRQHGFAGLNAGFTLLNGLIQNFWDGLYPLPDEDGLSTRVAVLVGLNGNNNNGTLIAPINTAALTKEGNYSAWSYTQALELSKITDAAARTKKMQAGAVALDTIKAAVKPSASEFYIDMQANIESSLQQFEQLENQLTTLCGADAPQGNNIRKSLTAALAALNVIAKNILTPDVPEETAMPTEGVEITEETVNTGGSEFKLTANIKNRLEAFKGLQAIAEFFKRTEPHSPVGYTLEKVVRWGDMALPQLLAELIPDHNAKDYYEKVVGILPPPPPAMGGMPGQYPGDPHMGMGGAPSYNPNMGMGGHPDPYGNNFGQPSGGYDNPMFK